MAALRECCSQETDLNPQNTMMRCLGLRIKRLLLRVGTASLGARNLRSCAVLCLESRPAMRHSLRAPAQRTMTHASRRAGALPTYLSRSSHSRKIAATLGDRPDGSSVVRCTAVVPGSQVATTSDVSAIAWPSVCREWLRWADARTLTTIGSRSGSLACCTVCVQTLAQAMLRTTDHTSTMPHVHEMCRAVHCCMATDQAAGRVCAYRRAA